MELADTPEKRRIGLMHREHLAEDRGMLFVYDNCAQHCMWMKNTLVPLSVGFFDDTGRLINIRQMEPLSEEVHCSEKPAAFSLEVNAGWFANHQVVPGSVVELPSAIDLANCAVN